MIDKALNKSNNYTLIIRIITFIMIVIGICLFFSPITTLLGYIPLVGGILKSTVGFIIFVAAIIVSIPLYIMALSLAWLWYHPKVGIPILLIGVSLIAILIYINSSSLGGDLSNKSSHNFINIRFNTY